MQMTNKIPVTDRDITQKRIQAGNAPLSSCNYERAERAEPSHPILRSSLMSGRGSLLAHTLVMLGSLATMLVIARLIANPAHTYKLGQNIVCACCGCISHDITEFEIVPDSYDHLRHLRVPEDVNILFDFSCGIDILDQNQVIIDKLGITQDKRILLCRMCHNQLSKNHQPSEALANFRWIRPVPEELQDLTWIEELLIARVHVCGSIVCLGQRNNPSSFFSIKGHVVFLPQDTTHLINLLPMSPASLSDIVKVVWTGKSKPD